MQTGRSSYPQGGYSSNVIDLGSASFSSQQRLGRAGSSSMAAATHSRVHSSVEDSSAFKKRRVERACDACRRRKTKCDGPRMPDNVCSNCLQNRKSCTYVEASKPRGPPKAYITGLEDRLERMDALLKRLRPEVDFTAELGPLVIRDSWKYDGDHRSGQEKSSSPSAPPIKGQGSPAPQTPAHTMPNVTTQNPLLAHRSKSGGTPRTDTDSSDYFSSSESEELAELSISHGMMRLTLRGLEPALEQDAVVDSQNRFHGKASAFKLIEPTRKLRDEHINQISSGNHNSSSSPDLHSQRVLDATGSHFPRRRPEFWSTPPWELAVERHRLENLTRNRLTDFPPPDLATTLIDLYFKQVNIMFPLLHRPTFERQWSERLHEKDPLFAGLCLSLFSVASQWSDDPRVLAEAAPEYIGKERRDPNFRWQRSGWGYFNAATDIHRASHSLFHPPCLFEVQTISLIAKFLSGTAFAPVAWFFISIGLRKIQDVGAHRKKVYGQKTSVEEELWKRAFWMLILDDRIGSAVLGRPCCIEEDFDLELPLEVDDEYWETEDPSMAFQQPPGKPATVSAFTSHLELTKIAAYALRHIYIPSKGNMAVRIPRPRLKEVLSQLNGAMTNWVETMPSHLRRTAKMDDNIFSRQSAMLFATHHLIEILIYRPFLPRSLHSFSNAHPPPETHIPCVAICINAGRCCARIFEQQMKSHMEFDAHLLHTAHIGAGVLIMKYWGLRWQERAQRDGLIEDLATPLDQQISDVLNDISILTTVLDRSKHRWRVADIGLQLLHLALPRSSDNLPRSISDAKDQDRRQRLNVYEGMLRGPSGHDYSSPASSSSYSYHSTVELNPPPMRSGVPQWFDYPHTTTHTMPMYPLWRAQDQPFTGGEQRCDLREPLYTAQEAAGNWQAPAPQRQSSQSPAVGYAPFSTSSATVIRDFIPLTLPGVSSFRGSSMSSPSLPLGAPHGIALDDQPLTHMISPTGTLVQEPQSLDASLPFEPTSPSYVNNSLVAPDHPGNVRSNISQPPLPIVDNTWRGSRYSWSAGNAWDSTANGALPITHTVVPSNIGAGDGIPQGHHAPRHKGQRPNYGQQGQMRSYSERY